MTAYVRLGLGAVASLLALALAAGAEPRAHAPLSGEERARARDAAFPAARAVAPRDSRVLLVERRPRDKRDAPARRADVYRYDYRRDELEHAVVALPDGDVLRRERVQGVQLPLLEEEVELALEIAFRDPPTRRRLDLRFRALTGRTLRDPRDLHVKAFVLHANERPSAYRAETRACGVARCAQLLLFTRDRTVLELQPIVDLSRGLVTEVRGF